MLSELNNISAHILQQNKHSLYAAYVPIDIISLTIYRPFLISTCEINFIMVFLHVHSTWVLVIKNINRAGEALLSD